MMNRAFALFALPVAGLVVGAAAVAALLVTADRLAVSDHDAARRAVLARAAALERAALAPGSPLACLDAGAGVTVENACEQVVFHSAQSAAAAVSYMGARLKLLSAASRLAKTGDGSVMTALAASRRAISLDRFGLAAHVLSIRDGCTADKCPAFALVHDASVLKANLRAQVYDQYVSRYADAWNAAPAVAKAPAVAQAPAARKLSAVPSVASIAPGSNEHLPPVKPGEKWDFPSSASIPPVSIMGKEPPLPKAAKAAKQRAEASAEAPPERAKPRAKERAKVRAKPSAKSPAPPHEAAARARKKPAPVPPKPPMQVTPSAQ